MMETILGLIDECKYIRKHAKIAYEQNKEFFSINAALIERLNKTFEDYNRHPANELTDQLRKETKNET